jgi:hypothetical protein
MSIVNSRRVRLSVNRVVIVGLSLLTQGAVANAQVPGAAASRQIRVLFIGNSLTYVNDLPGELQAMVAAAYPEGPSLIWKSVTPPGCTLRKHWDDGKAAATIAEARWDYVVLQEQSQIPFSDREQMFHYARLFDHEIKRVGAKTVLYMTFPLKKKFVRGDALPHIYATLGQELGAIVVPVDVAWHKAAKLDPQLALYKADGVHPAAAGTYLAVCCFAERLWGQPAGPLPAKLLRANPDERPLVDLDERQARELQQAAAAVMFPAAEAAAADSGKPAAPGPAKPVPADAHWVDLFDGKDLSGWNDRHSLWKVEDGVLIGSGGRGYLDTRRTDFANFHIRVEAMINDGGNSGLLFRAHPGGTYEAQIEANGNDRAKTGSLYVYNGKRISAKVSLKESPAPANQWFTMEVVADGFHVTILVDGKTVADFVDDDRVTSAGGIRLQVSNAETVAKFRKVQIRELAKSQE